MKLPHFTGKESPPKPKKAYLQVNLKVSINIIIQGISINSGWRAKLIKKVEFKAKIVANSISICEIFNVEVGFFKRLDAIHELLEVPFI